MNDRDALRLVEDFEHRRLPKPQWTHEAHLVVCRAVVQRLGPDAALDHLRRAIRSYNESTNTANTDTGGYHDTLTAYYVGAVDAVSPIALADLLAHPACARTAPLTHWTRDRLFSVAARRSWVPPDREPLTWWSPDLVGPAGGQL